MQSAMRLNAKGIKAMLSGGNEIARTEWLREGSIPSHTLTYWLWFCRSFAHIWNHWSKVWIYKGELSDVEKKKRKGKKATASQTKYRKAFKGRIHGNATRAVKLNYGQFGLKAVEPERIIGSK